jgi:hypothetical protein
MCILAYFAYATGIGSAYSSSGDIAVALLCLKLVRLLKAERYIKAFTVFDDILRDNSDLLAVSSFAAVVIWVYASAIMYYAERYNPDPDVQQYYTRYAYYMITLFIVSMCDLW